MSDLRKAAQQALEAMLNFPDDISDEMFESIRALRAALAQQAEPAQEPVAWLFTNLQSGDYDFCYQEDEHDHDREMWHKQPLYTAPPQRKPLTDEEIDRLWRDPQQGYWDYRKFARAIERKVRGEG